MISKGALVLIQQHLGIPLLWWACLHHVLEILLQAAMTEKLGPSSGPTEKYFERFQTYFNSLSTDDREAIRKEASSSTYLKPEDDFSEELFQSTRDFFADFMARKNGFQRDDYREFANLIMVRTKNVTKINNEGN